MRKPYPLVGTEEDLLNFCKDIARLRQEDLGDFTNLPNVFIRGRKVDKIPTGSLDTTGDRVGDFNYDTSYIYICVDNAGVAEWRRVAIGSW